MKILIADDDPIPRRLLESILRKWDYDVVVAGDGAEAWNLMQSEDAPKLAILDWQMPEMDGLEVCRNIRRRPDAPYVYIILLTAKDQKEDVITGMDAGADDYLIKPFDFYKLQVRLRAGRRILDLQAALLASVEELGRARRREVEIGSKIQQTLLLGQPPQDIQGIQIAALTIPSQQIDGDFIDFFPHNDTCLDIVVGDVMGKGVPAALFGAATKSQFLRALSHLASSLDQGALPEPEEIVNAVHQEMTGQFIGLDSFETLCYARFELAKNLLTFVDCGHTATIHYHRQTGDYALLQGENMPLGFSEREVYKQVTRPFVPGDMFLFYSDGITEAANDQGEMFGVSRLTELVQAHAALEPKAFIGQVHSAISGWAAAETFGDDLTCVAVKIPEITAPVNQPLGEKIAEAKVEFASDLAELTSIWAFVRSFCQELPTPIIDEDSIFQLELAVVEAASNVMKHAYDGRSDAKIGMEAEAYSNVVSVRLYHDGHFFDPEAADPPTFDGSREGGFGLYIIAQTVDEVTYTRDEQGRNCISLAQRRKDTHK